MTQTLKPVLALVLSLQIGVLAPHALATSATAGSGASPASRTENPLSPEEWDAFQDFAKQKNIPMLDEDEFARFCREEPASCQLAVINNNNDPSSRHVDATERGLFLSIFGALYTLLFINLLVSFLHWRRDGGRFGWQDSQTSSGTNQPTSTIFTNRKPQADGLNIVVPPASAFRSNPASSVKFQPPPVNPGDLIIKVPRANIAVNSSGRYTLEELGISSQISQLLVNTRTTPLGRNQLCGEPATCKVTFAMGNDLNTVEMGSDPIPGGFKEYIGAGEDDGAIIIPKGSYRSEDIPLWTQAAKSAISQKTGQPLGGSVVVIPPSAN